MLAEENSKTNKELGKNGLPKKRIIRAKACAYAAAMPEIYYS